MDISLCARLKGHGFLRHYGTFETSMLVLGKGNIPCMLIAYGTSDGPQNDLGSYLTLNPKPCSKRCAPPANSTPSAWVSAADALGFVSLKPNKECRV